MNDLGVLLARQLTMVLFVEAASAEVDQTITRRHFSRFDRQPT